MIEVEHLQVKYGNIVALSDVSLSIPDGKIISIVGANGAGKTTLVRTISGILRPSRGAIRYNGEDITKWGNDKIVQNGIIQVPEGRQIFSELTVLENIRMGAYCRKDSREAIEADIKEVFALFPRLEERVSQKGGSLSGGEQQMLAFGRALMSKPKILLLDEPSMGLAPIIVADIFQCVKKIASQGGTVVVIEQNVKMALKVSDYAYVLETGAVVNEGPSAQLAEDPKVQEAYLGG